MEEGGQPKVRVVRCPRCDKLLPELPNFTVYRCGGCNAVLQAKKRNPATDYSSERSDGGEAKFFVNSESCSDKIGTNSDSGSETDRESTGVKFRREEKLLLNSGANSSDSSAPITENSDVSQKPSASRLHGPLSGSGIDDRCSRYRNPARANVNDPASNVDESVKENLEVQYADLHHRIQQAQVPLGEERSRASVTLGLPRDRMNGVPVAPYADEGPSSQQIKPPHGHGTGGPVMKQNRDEADRAEYLKQDPMELLRMIDELRDQLSQSCKVMDRSKERIHVNRREAFTSYGHRGRDTLFLDGSSSLNRNSGLHPHLPNGYNMGQPNFFPPVHAQHDIPGYGEPFVSQTLERIPYHCRVQYPDRSMSNYPYVHPDLDPVISYHHKGFYHQPACSCVHCYERHWMLPAQAPPPFITNRRIPNRRVPNLANNNGFYHVGGTSLPGSQSYNQRYTSSSLYTHEVQTQQRATFPGKRDKHPCQPKAGAAPFVVCCGCFELLLLPQKLQLMARKQFKLRCGSCSQVILLELDGKRLVTSAPPPAMPATTISNGSSDGFNGDLPSQVHAAGHPDISYSEAYNSPGYNIQSTVENILSPTSSQEMTGKKNELNFSDSEKMQGLSTSSSRSEDAESPDSMICHRDVPSSMELPFEDEVTADVPGLPLHEHLAHPLSNQVTDGSRKGSTSKRHDQDKIVSFNENFQQASMKDVQMATEIDLSVDEYQNPGFSQDYWEVRRDDDQCGIDTSGESFFAGLIKKSFKDISLSNKSVEGGRSKVSINGHPISDRLAKKAEKLAGPVHPGEYWYDYRAGFWGVMGHQCLGIIPPFIEEFNYPMPENCAGGNTGVIVNGRELHQRDLDLLVCRGLPPTAGRSYIIEISGKVFDEASGEELDSLGRLAPTVEKMKHGLGMRVPRAIA